MSASEALVTPTISALSAKVTVCAAPSFDFTVSVWPSTFSMVPLRRCVCCAEADETAKAATRATPARIPILFICFLQLTCSRDLFSETCQDFARQVVRADFRALPNVALPNACAASEYSGAHRGRKPPSPSSHGRGHAVLAVGNVGDVERAIGQFRGAGDEHLHAGLEFGLAGGLVA